MISILTLTSLLSDATEHPPPRLGDAHPRDLDRAAGDHALIPVANDQPPALLVAEIKFRHGSGFGRLLIRRLNRPEVLPALSDDRDAPASQLGGGGLLSPGFHVASMLP